LLLLLSLGFATYCNDIGVFYQSSGAPSPASPWQDSRVGHWQQPAMGWYWGRGWTTCNSFPFHALCSVDYSGCLCTTDLPQLQIPLGTALCLQSVAAITLRFSYAAQLRLTVNWYKGIFAQDKACISQQECACRV